VVNEPKRLIGDNSDLLDLRWLAWCHDVVVRLNRISLITAVDRETDELETGAPAADD